MAVKQIPNLTPAISLTGLEMLEIVQSGATYRTTAQAIANLSAGSTPSNAGTVTTYQFLTALAAVPADVNILFQALQDFNDPAMIQFSTSAYVRVGSPIYVLCQSTYGFSNAQMDAIMADAITYPTWG